MVAGELQLLIMLRRWVCFLLCLFIPAWVGSLRAEPVGEYAMKATYLYNFSLLVSWPDNNPAEDFNLCLLGYDNIGQAARMLEGKQINGRRLVVARLSTLAFIRKCHVLFIAEKEQSRLRSILKELGDDPILTVSEVRDTAGTMITVYPENERLVFEVDQSQAKRTGLVMSSKLLHLAKNAR